MSICHFTQEGKKVLYLNGDALSKLKLCVSPSRITMHLYAYRKYLKLRFHQLRRNEINLEGLRVVQLNQRIQRVGTTCGFYCLMVWMIMNPKLPYMYITV